mmetsp:Transcript_10163/g.37226  ORF Transcript_10163/g.37226 Transcript_10163/m.37226 type:complete len:300 (-) Transcript_10163:6085-6984(-)
MSSTARSLQEALKELRRAAASCYPSAAQAHSKHGLAEQDCRLSFRLGVDVVRLCVLARDHTAGNGTPFLQIDSTDLAFEYWLPNVSGSQAQVQWNSLLQSTRMTIDCTLPQREHCLFSFDGNASAFEMYFKQQGQKHQPGTPLHRGTKLLNSVEKQFSLFVRKTANHHLIYDLLTGTDSILSLDVGIFLSLVDWLLTSDPDLSDGRTGKSCAWRRLAAFVLLTVSASTIVVYCAIGLDLISWLVLMQKRFHFFTTGSPLQRELCPSQCLVEMPWDISDSTRRPNSIPSSQHLACMPVAT